MIEAYDGKYLDVLCIGIINNIWNKRGRVKTYDNGSTNPLYELCSNIMSFDQPSEHMPHQGNFDRDTDMYESTRERMLTDNTEEYDYDKDQKVQQANEFIKELVELKKESPDTTERFRARVFAYSNFTYKNVRQFSKASGIPYNVCWEANHKMKQVIKININDLRPDSGF